MSPVSYIGIAVVPPDSSRFFATREGGKRMDPWDVPTWTLILVPLLFAAAAALIGIALASP